MTVDSTKARSIFSAAVENHTPDQWGKFLDDACGEDIALRMRVEMLLAAHQGEDSFLDRGNNDASAEVTEIRPIPGERFSLLRGSSGDGQMSLKMQPETSCLSGLINRDILVSILK